MSGLHIRDERPEDHAVVHAVQAAAFGQEAEAELVEALRVDAHPRLSLVAEREGHILGHVFFSPVKIGHAADAPEFAGLAPVGVLPDEQGTGVGSALVRAGLARCQAMGWRAVFLVGDPRYYARFGFVLAAPLGFHYLSPAFDPALQVAVLEPGALDGIAGEVVYHPAFAVVGG